MKRQLQEPDPDPVAAVKDNLVGAVATLAETSADGTPLFSPEEQGEKFVAMSYDVLTAQRNREINGDMSLEEAAKLVDPNFNYTVTIGDGDEDSMVFQKNNLHKGLPGRLQDESEHAVWSFLEGSK
jgi:hypothetical protein